MTAAELAVRMHGAHAGTLRRAETGQLAFTYDRDYMAEHRSVPLSLSLPFSDDTYGDNPISTWITSLLPDNQRVLDNWYRLEQVADRSPFGILSTPIGYDCAGAVQFCSPDTAEELEHRHSGAVPLSDEDMRTEIARIVADPTTWTADGIDPYFCLGGMQAKIALHRNGTQWARPYGDTPTTRILKPRAGRAADDEPERQEAMEGSRMAAIGEHLCLAAAKRLGIPAADSWIEQHGSNIAAVITRFDRRNEGGSWERLHQEDMCQALGLPAVKKYEKDGGPTISRIGDLIRSHSSDPDHDLASYGDALLYAWLTINRDAHAKNYSVLHLKSGNTRLAPLYDLHSSLFFTGKSIGTIELAARYGNDFTVHRSNSREMLPTLAARLVLPQQTLLDHAEHLASNICAAFTAEISQLPSWAQIPNRMSVFMERLQIRAESCLKTIDTTRTQRSPAKHRSTSHKTNDTLPPAQPRTTLCPKRVKSTKAPCILSRGHRGHCRGR